MMFQTLSLSVAAISLLGLSACSAPPSQGSAADGTEAVDACLAEAVPGVDDLEAHTKRCAEAIGRSADALSVGIPNCANVPDTEKSLPNVQVKEFACNWEHNGVRSKDGNWLQARATPGCDGRVPGQITAAGANMVPVCADQTSFVVAGTKTKNRPFGGRSFKAWGSITYRALVKDATIDTLCTREPTHPACFNPLPLIGNLSNAFGE